MALWHNYWTKVGQLFRGDKLTALDWKTLEDALLAADLGPQLTEALLKDLKTKAATYKDATSAASELRNSLTAKLAPYEGNIQALNSSDFKIILMVGVNGAGKTTLIGKLARYFKQQGLKPLVAAGDTFRAAAIEQLTHLAKQQEVPVIAQQSGADSAAVIFDALNAAKARKFNVVLADTAGRLPTQHDFLQELNKIQRVIYKFDPNIHLEVFMVLDATIGQHAIMQVREFTKAIKLTGLCLTKLDSPAKGGVIFNLVEEFKRPIYFIGIGENAEDLMPFNAASLVSAILP